MTVFLKSFFGFIFVSMIYVVVSTSFQSNMFDLMKTWDSANFMAPWFSATLWDFYANVAFISVWIAYKERSILRGAFWILMLALWGSIATAGYVLIELFKLKPGEGLREVFINRKDA